MPKRKHIDVQQAIGIILLTNGEPWLHTQGMQALGHPELEIVGIPRFLYRYAGALLNEVADYILNGDKPVKAGERFGIGGNGPPLVVQFIESPGRTHPDAEKDADRRAYYANNDVWRLIDPLGAGMACSACATGTPHAGHSGPQPRKPSDISRH